MKFSRKLLTDLIASGALSLMFGGLLVHQIMTVVLGERIGFVEFLSVPDRLLFCLMMTMFVAASWLMKGTNNRTVLMCWAIMFIVHFTIFMTIHDYFLNEFKNIYALSIAGLAGAMPLVLLMRYRIQITIPVSNLIWKAGLLRRPLGRYLGYAGLTDFEYHMRTVLYAGFTVEFLYSLYLVTYGLLNQIPYYGNITAHMLEHKHWTPYSLYFSSLNMLTVLYILIIGLHTYRDFKMPDAFCYGISDKQRNEIRQKLLDKYLKQDKENKSKNKHDH